MSLHKELATSKYPLHCDLLFKMLVVLKRLLTFLALSQNDTEVKVTATCIRVPVMRAHAESVNLQFENPLDEVIIIHIKPFFATKFVIQ